MSQNDLQNLKPTLAVISQGCAANFGEGEKLARLFQEEYRIVFDITNCAPDAAILNVCTVKGNASALKLLREIYEKVPNIKLFITGCAPKDFRIAALKITDKITFTSLAELSKNKEQSLAKRTLRNIKYIGIVNIEFGCLDACAYCSTRLVKGRLQSLPTSYIIEQIKNLVNDGCKQIQLTGQDCGCYGFDINTNLAKLVKEILTNIKGDYKIRLGMGNPRHVLQYANELLECFYDSRIYKFLHLPVQSGSEHVLKSMNRKHSAYDYLSLAKMFCSKFELFTLSTDLIVGFPGETDADFFDTIKILQESRPTICNITRFVARPGTLAYNMQNKVSGEIMHERSAALASEFQKIALENNSLWIGSSENVVVEKSGFRAGTFIARNDAYRPVAITSKIPLEPGQTINVKIVAAEPFALIGKIIE